jgi:GNAT superfamily N-acetyltransferase
LPVYLQWLDEPNEQDQTDLDKLYADAPANWFEQNQPANGADWAQQKAKQGERIALGYFNDHIVCAACLVEQSGISDQAYMYTVQQLCVRDVTRRRGVAKQLLVRLCQWANKSQSSLYIKDEESQLSGLYELGFVQYLQGWRYTPL